MTTTTPLETITQIANDLVEHCKAEIPAEEFVTHDAKIWDKHYADSWTSIEGDGKTYVGREAVIAKYTEWASGVVMHGCEVTGPFVGPNGFSVIFDLDMESKAGAFPRMNMREVANYTVENGKITQEEFRFPPMSCGEC
jgi:uncharacterized protein CbrC (UPF0167 family)